MGVSENTSSCGASNAYKLSILQESRRVSAARAFRLAPAVPTSVHSLGIAMQLVETRRGVQYFTFEHHREYQQVQFKFLDAVESMDPNNIVVCSEISLILSTSLPCKRDRGPTWCK